MHRESRNLLLESVVTMRSSLMMEEGEDGQILRLICHQTRCGGAAEG